MAVLDSIEGCDNPHRRHSSIDDLSPKGPRKEVLLDASQRKQSASIAAG